MAKTKKKKGSGKYQKWITEEGLIKIEGWARDGLTDEQIAHNIGIQRTTLYDWKNKHPDISDALKKGKEVIDRQVENALLKRALGYEYTEVTRERIVDTGQKKRHNGESELTTEEWELAQRYFKGECAYCGSSDKITKDHLDPLKNGGELKASNIVPACGSCNSSKRDHQWLSWYQKQTFYSKDRGQKILDYIDFVLSMPVSAKDSEMLVTKEVTKQVSPDTTAGIFWLKNRKPKEWRDRKETEISGGLDVINPLVGLTTEEIREALHRASE